MCSLEAGGPLISAQPGLPMVSVIIPSAGKRHQLLQRAIESALAGWKKDEIEVVVIFNGVNGNLASEYTGSSNIRIFYIPQANVCDARNFGLQVSTGEIVRFLDDDDYLIPDIAVKQCRELLLSTADVSSYALVIQDEEGTRHGELRQPPISDFVAAQLSSCRMQLVHAHTYRKAAIDGVRWTSAYSIAEDTVWLLSLALKRDWGWIKSDEIVGAWYQHRAARLSYTYAVNEPHQITAESILKTVDQLRIDHRMTEEREHAALNGLWECIHRGFYLRPFYWHRMAKIALRMERQVDEAAGKKAREFLWIPLAVQWVVLPKRIVNHLIRNFRALFHGWNYVRHL